MTEPACNHPIGLAPLSLLGAHPADLVETAAAAGYDFVGIRVAPVTATEKFTDLTPGSPDARRTLDALRATGLRVRDVEFLVLDGTLTRETWLPALEAGANLGASTFTVAASDTDQQRLLHTLQAFTDNARPFGITPTLEAISYQAVSTLPQAAELARAAGCWVLPDALHFQRAQGTVADARTAADLSPLVQICDARAAAPEDLAGRLHESRAERLVPGDGDVDFTAFLSAFPATAPISVEVPNPLREELGDGPFARRLLQAAREVLAR
ncbi:sugar phosphate isomerase/epimerase [Luteococcus sp. H138]|uniref:sugar phosphate isomerase/epimerase family protein n=1 Tax=unclassified Luteococcus TaxID=2639923 RepID=UPI00313D0B66